MKRHKISTIAFRRKREGRTNYKKRIRLIESGIPRLVIRRSLKAMTAQIVEFDSKGDKVIVSASGSDLTKMGWNYNHRNTPSAYLIGLLIAKKAKEKKISKAVVDLGLQKSIPSSRLYAVVKGAVENGMDIPHSESVLPAEERINGKHIEDYANKLKENKDEFEKRFSEYLKRGLDPTQITKAFADAKNKIIGA